MSEQGTTKDLSSADSETACPTREDKRHCNCWYDGEACCACGDNGADASAESAVWCKNCGYHVVGGLCGYDTPCGDQS